MINNNVTLIGKLKSNYIFSHESYQEKFYIAEIEVKRLSGVIDTIPLMMSQSLLNESYLNNYVEINGELRSHNIRINDEKRKVMLSVFVHYIMLAFKSVNENEIFIEGYLCKKPIYRMTPKGREVADMIVAVNRDYGHSDYLPCIAWGENARMVKEWDSGDHICIIGRIQSRQYCKNGKIMTAYEVSVNEIRKDEGEI